jgi:hypothetical protein
MADVCFWRTADDGGIACKTSSEERAALHTRLCTHLNGRCVWFPTGATTAHLAELADDEYVAHLRIGTTWVEAEIVAAAADLLNIVIDVDEEQLNEPVRFGRGSASSGSPVVNLLHRSHHFEAIVGRRTATTTVPFSVALGLQLRAGMDGESKNDAVSATTGHDCSEVDEAGGVRPQHAGMHQRPGGRGWCKLASSLRRRTQPRDAPPPGFQRVVDKDCVSGGIFFSIDRDRKVLMYPEPTPITYDEHRALDPAGGPPVWVESRSFTTAQHPSGCVGEMCAVELRGNVVVIAVIVMWHASAGVVELVPAEIAADGSTALWNLNWRSRIFVSVIDPEEGAPPIGAECGLGSWGSDLFLLSQIR